MTPELPQAFQYHLRTASPYLSPGYGGRAVYSIAKARRDVVAGTPRYPGPVRVIHASDTAWTSGSEEFAPAICRMIEREARNLYSRITESRVKRAKLASGDSSDLYFWTGDKRLQEAFCEGANLDAFPC